MFGKERVPQRSLQHGGNRSRKRNVFRRRTVLCVYGAVRGVGGIDSWQSDVEDEYHISAEAVSYTHLDTYVSQLSGGQKQRVGIARALTTTPDILLCDEATSALDPQTTESILKLLKKINKEMGVTILLITHQMQVVQMICNKVAVMENGKVVESGSVLDVFGKPQAPVTKRFVQTVINDQIPESIVSLVKEQKEHFQVERLKFIGSSVKRPVISDICQVEGIVVNILGATVQELQENVMCVFILQLIGSEDKICEAEKQIDANGVIRERVEVI